MTASIADIAAHTFSSPEEFSGSIAQGRSVVHVLHPFCRRSRFVPRYWNNDGLQDFLRDQRIRSYVIDSTSLPQVVEWLGARSTPMLFGFSEGKLLGSRCAVQSPSGYKQLLEEWYGDGERNGGRRL